MIIFLDEEKTYRHWVTHHRRGYVLAGQHRQHPRELALHRATCGEVKPPAGSRAHMTTGKKWKACSLQPQQLLEWGKEWQQEVEVCPVCRPLDILAAEPQELHLTKLGRDILDYVLEAAVIHFDEDGVPYRLNAEDVANCFGTTVGHLSPAFRRLFEEGLLRTTGSARHLTPRKRLFPTILALKRLPELAAYSEAELQIELQKLEK